MAPSSVKADAVVTWSEWIAARGRDANAEKETDSPQTDRAPFTPSRIYGSSHVKLVLRRSLSCNTTNSG